MTENKRTYLLDANIFIQAKNEYYSFSVCPGFWEALPWLHQKGFVWSIDRVGDELLAGKDDLAEWVKKTAPGSMFSPTTDKGIAKSFSEIMAWVQAYPQFVQSAKAEFANEADGWLIAFARVKGFVVVTHEVYAADTRRKVRIPNVCKQFSVEHVNTFKMLEDLRTYFTWAPPR